MRKGRRRILWFNNLRQWTGMTPMDLFRVVDNKIRWINGIANIHRG